MDVHLVNELLEAAGKNDSTEVDRIITQLGLENLDGAAESGTLGVITEERGLRKLLHHSARNGTVNLLKIVLKDPNINVNAQQELGCTALILACQYGHIDIATLLLEKGADVLLCSNDGFSCLHVAAFHGRTKVVNLLLHGKSDRNEWDNWDPSLPTLSWETLLALIRKKTLAEMFSALHMAGYWDEGVEIAKSILESMTSSLIHKHELPPGANLRASFDVDVELWQDFLFKVRGELHGQGGKISEEMIQQNMMTFRKSGVGSAIERKLGAKYESLVQAFVEIVSYANARDAWGRTALHHAAWENRDELVRFLMWNFLGCVVNINLADYDGYTPLHLAAKKNCKAVVRQLVRPSYGDDNIGLRFAKEDCLLPNAVANPEGQCQKITMEIEMFLERCLGKETNSRSGPRMNYSVWTEDRKGVTPLHYAVEYEHDEVVELLRHHPKTDVFLCASDGQSPWTIAFPPRWKLPNTKFTNTQNSLRGKLDSRLVATQKWGVTQEWGAHLHHMLLKQAVALARRAEYDSESSETLQMLERQICLGFVFVFLEKRKLYDPPPFLKTEKDLTTGKQTIKEWQEWLTTRKQTTRKQTIKEWLEDVREDINIDDWNLTLLHVASYFGYEQEIAELLTFSRYRNSVNEQENLTDMGQTPLHFAVTGSTDAVAILLKEETLDLTQINGQGLTSLAFLEKIIQEKDWLPGFYSVVQVAQVLIWGRTEQLLLLNKDLVEILYRDRQVYVDAANAILVGAALIASVTFAGFLQPPLGYVNYDEYLPDPSPPSTPANFAAVGQYKSVGIFWVFNSLSFFSAIATVVCGAGAVLPDLDSTIGQEVHRVREWLKATAVLLAVSILCVLGAFTAAGMATLPNIAKYQSNIIATATIGLVLCSLVLCAFFYRLYLSLDASRSPKKFIKGAFVFSLTFLVILKFMFLWGPINLYVLIGKLGLLEFAKDDFKNFISFSEMFLRIKYILYLAKENLKKN